MLAARAAACLRQQSRSDCGLAASRSQKERSRPEMVEAAKRHCAVRQKARNIHKPNVGAAFLLESLRKDILPLAGSVAHRKLGARSDGVWLSFSESASETESASGNFLARKNTWPISGIPNCEPRSPRVETFCFLALPLGCMLVTCAIRFPSKSAQKL